MTERSEVQCETLSPAPAGDHGRSLMDPRDEGAPVTEFPGFSGQTDPITISCDDCIMQRSDHCRDCVVTFICGREPDDALVIDADEARAVRLLGRAGLVPVLRHVPREDASLP